MSRTSAAVLCLGGFALLFGPDAVLPALAPGMPAESWWMGQVVAAAWLAMAAQNWLQRGILMGGIYARPLVYSNFVLYLITALSLLRAVTAGTATRGAFVIAAPACLFAVVYAVLLFRGPFDAAPKNTQPSA